MTTVVREIPNRLATLACGTPQRRACGSAPSPSVPREHAAAFRTVPQLAVSYRDSLGGPHGAASVTGRSPRRSSA